MKRVLNYRAMLALVGIFLAGAIVGGVATRAWICRKAPRPSAQEIAERHLQRLVDELALTPAQVERIRPVIGAFEAEIREARQRAFTGIREIIREMNERIEAELTPAQREAFSQMCQREFARFETFLKGRHGHGKGRGKAPGDGAEDAPGRARADAESATEAGQPAGSQP